MSEVLRATGGLTVLTDTFLGGMEPLLANRLIAVPVLYWTAFVYHFFTASGQEFLRKACEYGFGCS